LRISWVWALILGSCGYQFRDTAERPTVSVPFVQGDYEGQLTNELVKQVVASGAYEYTASGGEYVLQAKVVGDHSDRIGYQYDRKEFSGKRLGNLQANENRRTISVEVSLLDSASGTVVSGPVVVSAFSDYDYVDINSIRDLAFTPPGGFPESVLNFSIGQLDSIEGAQDDAILSAYRQLAQKIVEAIARH